MSAPVEVTPELLREWRLPTVLGHADKEARGRVLVLAAGAQVAGATLLTALAALRAGGGKLQIAAPRSLATSLALSLPEARVIPACETQGGELSPDAVEALAEPFGRTDVAVIGPGMIDSGAAGELALRLLERGGPVAVVDAAAMKGLAAEPERARGCAGRMVVTPHAGEMAGLSGRTKAEVEADPVVVVRTAAARLQAVVALKGAVTYVASPDGLVWRHTCDAPGLGTSGSGDVLAGVIAGLIARGASPAQATAWGVFVHGRAGERLGRRVGRLGYLARELLDEIAPILDELDGGGP